ncbi:Fanconi anemia group I protein-like isoform X2 [Daphnia carinata]|uniref:Fanconi anemia group I protein-like isoform X2 n=1 Tax=Daphnia carinata TaxID=120202 RepID=UPI0028684510|nr:Fanconi anemia group I protein-like isoform X2 [Daphnia carinata]
MAVDVVRKLSKLLLSNNSQQQKEILQQTIDTLSREDILRAVPDVVHSNGAPNLIRLVLEGLSNSTHHRDNLTLNVMKSILTELCDSEAVPENCAVDIVHLMSLNSHDLSSNNLAELVQLCLSFIQKGKNLRGKWLSLFPMIFSELAKQSRVTLDSNTVTGAEYCDGVISSLCDIEIAVDDAVAFTAVLRELRIPATIVHKFVLKLCAIIPDMEPQEVPPFVYQLLFLCYQSDHLVPMEHLAKYFEVKLSRYGQSANLSSRGESMEINCDIETGSTKEISQAKATSIFHISRAAATGHPLGKEFVKFLRSRVDVPELVLVPFILEVALSLGALPQLRDIIGLLRKLVQRLLRSNERLRHSAWMRDLMLGKQIDVQKMFDTIMQQGTSEGDNIVKGFELLAFDLLEIRNAGGFGRPTVAGPSIGNASSSSGTTSGTVTEQCWHIGAHILLQMIRKFPDSAPLIVKKLAERLQDVSNDLQYITTICMMVQHNPLSMLECKASFTMLLYSMEYRGLVSAKRLYAGISPLFRSSGALRDSAFLVLRKLLHSCLEEVRQVAVVGFLEILKNFRFYIPTMGSSLSQTSISSQATVDVHHSQTSNSNRAFCSELLKLLQCALSQQASVRLTLYQNLPEVVSRNPELLPECIKMLRCHLKFFIDTEAIIQVDMCITKDGHNSHVIEPLGHLIQAIQQSILRSGKANYLAKEDIDPKSEDQVDLGVLLIRKVLAKMAESSIDDYLVGDVQEPNAQLKIQTLSSVCIALADFCVADNATTSVIAAKRLVGLYEMQTRFDSLLSEVGKGKGKGKAPKRTKKGQENSIDELPITDDTPKAPMKIFEKCTPSLQSISVFMGYLKNSTETTASNEEETFAFLKPQIGLRLWFAQSAFSKYQAFCNTKDIEGLSSESVTKFSGTIACALLLHCQNTRQVVDDRSSAMYCTALKCLHDIILGFCKHNPTKLSRLLTAMDEVERPAAGIPLENQIAKTLKHFKDLLNHLLSGRENEDLVTKAVLPIVGTLTVLSDQLNPAGDEYTKLSNWTHDLCKNVECRESSIAKPLINLLAHLSMASDSSPSILEELGTGDRQERLKIPNYAY